MAFGIHLSTSKSFSAAPLPLLEVRLTEPPKPGRFTLNQIFSDSYEARSSILGSVSLTFPDPGYVGFGFAEIQHGTIDRPVPVAVWAKLGDPITQRFTGFSVSSAGSNDSLVVFSFNAKSFAATMFHRTEGLKLAPCEVSCADGKTAHPCVTCKSDDVEIRICC
jgi:hypothetical protein